MSKQSNKPLALAVGAALVGGLALSGSAFAMTDLAGGYMVGASTAAAAANKKAESNCGAHKKAAEANCGADKKAAEAKCGADKKTAEANCGADKKAGEGGCGGSKTGEGKCGVAFMDTDKDGKVSAAEFAVHHDQAMFAMHDANKDGFLTAEEMKATEGKCGEAKCGADKKPSGDKAKMEGKCGEGKCGGMA